MARPAPSTDPELSNQARLRYPLRMSSTIGRRLGAKARAACALAVAIVVLTTGLPMTHFCCVSSAPCCAVGRPPQATAQPEMSAPIPDCCQPIVRNGTPVTSERLAPRPDAPDFATLPITPQIAANLPSESRPPMQAADPQPDPPPPPRASRAPPLS